jgi:hypothetical protein
MASGDLQVFQERQSASKINLFHLVWCDDHQPLFDLNVFQPQLNLQLRQPKLAIRHLQQRALKQPYQMVMSQMLDDLMGKQLQCIDHLEVEL